MIDIQEIQEVQEEYNKLLARAEKLESKLGGDNEDDILKEYTPLRELVEDLSAMITLAKEINGLEFADADDNEAIIQSVLKQREYDLLRKKYLEYKNANYSLNTAAAQVAVERNLDQQSTEQSSSTTSAYPKLSPKKSQQSAVSNTSLDVNTDIEITNQNADVDADKDKQAIPADVKLNVLKQGTPVYNTQQPQQDQTYAANTQTQIQIENIAGKLVDAKDDLPPIYNRDVNTDTNITNQIVDADKDKQATTSDVKLNDLQQKTIEEQCQAILEEKKSNTISKIRSLFEIYMCALSDNNAENLGHAETALRTYVNLPESTADIDAWAKVTCKYAPKDDEEEAIKEHIGGIRQLLITAMFAKFESDAVKAAMKNAQAAISLEQKNKSTKKPPVKKPTVIIVTPPDKPVDENDAEKVVDKTYSVARQTIIDDLLNYIDARTENYQEGKKPKYNLIPTYFGKPGSSYKQANRNNNVDLAIALLKELKSNKNQINSPKAIQQKHIGWTFMPRTHQAIKLQNKKKLHSHYVLSTELNKIISAIKNLDKAEQAEELAAIHTSNVRNKKENK